MEGRRSLALLALLPLAFVPNSGAAQGDLDPTFGSHGVVTTPWEYEGAATALALEPDGKMVVGGWVEMNPQDGFGFAASRYNPDGSLDQSFGSGGKTAVTVSPTWENYASAMAVQPDGKIVVAGTSVYHKPNPNPVPVPGPERNDFALVRFNVDGSLDRSFGTDGRVNEPQGSFGNPGSGYERIEKIVLQPDGKIVAAGSANGSFVLVRYNSDGSLDHTFGSGGAVATPFGSAYATAIGLVRQPDGKLVAAGEAFGTFEERIAVARYMADGSLDSSFGSGGTLTTALGAQSGASSVLVQRDGKIVIGGSFGSPDSSGFALVRYTPTGLLDRTFSHGGTVVTDFGKLVPNGKGYPASVASLSLQADGKIVAVGTEEEPGSTGPIFKVALARYYPNGAPDEPFLRTLALGPAESTASDAALQPDGKIVLTGRTGRSDGKDGAVFALARVLARPTFCVVPNVKGRRLAAAKQRISRRNCSVGKVSRIASRKVPRGRVIGEKPHPGMRLDVQAKIALVVSNGVPRSK